MPDAATIIVCPTCSAKNRVRPSATGVPRCSVCHTLLPRVVEASPDTWEAEMVGAVPTQQRENWLPPHLEPAGAV